MNRIAKLILIPLIAGCVVRADDRPVVTSPVQDEKIAGIQAEVMGRVPKGTFPFFAVQPLKVAPQTWIQPKIHAYGDDGSVIGTIYLGHETEGANQTFLVYLLACTKKDPFGKDTVVQSFPRECTPSAPVKVFRVR